MTDALSATPTPSIDESLRALLAWMASSDGALHEGELALLRRIFPTATDAELRAEVAAGARADPASLPGLVEPFQTAARRWTALRFAARMAWRDGTLDPSEQALLQQLAAAMELPAGAVDRVVREMRPDLSGRITAERLLRLLHEIQWDAVQLASGALVSPDLQLLNPGGHEILARIGVDRVEVAGLGTQGLVARFRDGAAFVAWSDIVSHGRDAGLGAGLTLLTEDQHGFALVDARLSGLGTLIDRLLGDDERRVGMAPTIAHLRGS